MKKIWAKYGGYVFGVIIGMVIVGGLIVGGSMVLYPRTTIAEEVVIDYKQALDATVILTSDRGMLSGVIITEDGYILSCAHGDIMTTAYALRYYDDTEMPLILPYDVECVYRDVVLDLAIYKILDDCTWPYASFGPAPEVGDELLTIGCPLGRPYYLSWGKLIDIRSRETTGMSYLLHSCSTNQGNSGGPTFNMRGEIVGIVVYGYAVLVTNAGYVNLVDGVYAVRIDDFVPGIWGIIDVHRNLQVTRDDWTVLQKHIDDIERKRPN